MKWISLFRAVLNVVYFFSVASAVAAPLAVFLAARESTLKFEIGGQVLENVHWSFYVVLVLALIGYFVFVRMLYLMKQAARFLNSKTLFSHKIADQITLAGKNCVLAAVLTKLPAFLYGAFIPLASDSFTNFRYSITFGYGFDSLLVIISFGFFLMLTGIVMKEVNTLKQENDLTI